MQYNTKLNVGDKVWHINDGQIKSSPITEILIRHMAGLGDKPFVDYKWDGISRSEADEGKLWWRSQEALISHLLDSLPGGPTQPCHCESNCQCTGGDEVSLAELLENMMRGEENPNPCGCGCEHQDTEGVLSDMPKFQSGRPKHVTEEEAFVNELAKHSKPQDIGSLFDELFAKPHTKHHPDEEAIDREFDQLFGEHVCTRPKARNKNELDQLYEDLFDR